MELNKYIFPAPEFNYHTPKNFPENLIFIPKQNDKGITKLIPCLLILANQEAPTNNFLIMFHGNAEDIFLLWAMGNRICHKLQINVLIVEYPGYSLYEESKSSETMLQDSLYVYDYIKANFDNVEDENVFIFGRSIGTGPAVYLASKRKAAALFLVSAFTSIKAVAGNINSCFSCFVKQRFTSMFSIRDVKFPVLLIHGEKDPLIPCAHSKSLFLDCPAEIKEAHYPPEMTHNDFNVNENIIKPISDFIGKYNLRQEDEATVIPKELYSLPPHLKAKIDNATIDKYTVFKTIMIQSP